MDSQLNGAMLDKVIVIGSTFAVLAVSYIPLHYVVNALGVTKLTIVAGVIVLVGLLILLRAVTAGFREVLDRETVKVLVIYLPFVAYSIVRYLLGESYSNAEDTLRSIALINPVFIGMALYCRRDTALVIKVVLLMSCVYAGFSAVAMVRADPIFFIDYVFPGLKIEGGLYQNIARYLGLVVVAAVYYFQKGSPLNWLLLCGIAVSFIGMIMVGGRSPFVAAIVVLALHLFYSIRLEPKRFGSAKLFIALAILVLAVGLIIAPGVKDLLQANRLIGRFALLLEDGDASLRLFLFGSAVKLFLTDFGTFLFGAGIASFPASIGKSVPGWYPHNIVLELLAEYGIVGCVLFFLPLGYAVRMWWLARRESFRPSGTGWVTMLIAAYFFLIACFSGDVATSWSWLFFGFLVLPRVAGAR